MNQNKELANLLIEIARHAPEAFMKAVSEGGLLDPEKAEYICREAGIDYEDDPDDAK